MMEKSKRNIIAAALVLAVLAAAIAALAFLNRPEVRPESGTVVVKQAGVELGAFSLEDIRALDYVEAEKEIVSASFNNDQGLFRGVALRALLAAAGAEPENAAQVIVRSKDGFVSAFPIGEVMDGDGIMLAYALNGENLGSLEDGGSGPFRIVVADDEFGARCAKYVCEIEVK